MMPEAREQLVGGKEHEEIFGEVDAVARHFAVDTETIRAFEVESMPLILGSEKERHALVVSFVHGGEYAGNDQYRCTAANVFCSLVDAANITKIAKDGSAWDMGSLALGNGAIQSIREPSGGFSQDPELVVRRDEDKVGNFNRTDTNSLIDKILDIDIPGSHRLHRAVSKVAESPTIYYSVVISRSQSYDDFKMVRGFIKNLGIGRVSTSNLVPVYDQVNDKVQAVVIDQERHFDPSSPSPVIEWAHQVSSEINIVPSPSYAYRQESRGNEKLMKINDKEETEYLLDRLEHSAEAMVKGADDLYNIPYAQQDIARLIGHHASIL